MPSRVEQLEEGFEAYNSGRIAPGDPSVERISEEAQWHSMVARLAGDPYRGRAGFLRWYTEVQEAFQRPTVSSHDYREVGDRVLALGRFSAIGRSSGARIDEPILHVFDFDRDAKFCRYEAYLSPDAELLARLGWKD